MSKLKLSLSWIATKLEDINGQPRKKLYFLLFLTALSLFSLHFILFTYTLHVLPLGFDFANPYWFQNCVGHANSPYFVPGHECGDQLNRSMVYPPVIYWFYIWTRLVSLPVGVGIWIVVILGGIFFSLRRLPEFRRERATLFLYLALLVQLPAVFALERGNNDVLIMVVWTLAMMSWMNARFFLAGALGALAFMLKLYPAIPLFILGLAFIARIHKDRRWTKILGSKEFRFCAGFLTGFVALWLGCYQQNMDYFFKVLPEWMKNSSGIGIAVHSIFFSVGGHAGVAPSLLGIALIFSWVKLAHERLDEDPVLIWVGLLALSTYFSRTSNDYNLITTYPLIALCWFRSFNGTLKNIYFFYFVGSFLGPIGWRWFWKNMLFHPPTAHVIYQVLWLCSFLLLLQYKNPRTFDK